MALPVSLATSRFHDAPMRVGIVKCVLKYEAVSLARRVSILTPAGASAKTMAGIPSLGTG